MLKVCHVTNARSVRVIWMLEELGVPYEIERFEFTDLRDKPERLARNHPYGVVPVIDHDGFTLFESGAIVDYLIDQFGNGRFRPEDGTRERAIYRQWMHFAEGSATSPFTNIAQHRMLRPEAERIEAVAAEGEQRGRMVLRGLEKYLPEEGYLLGSEMTGADVMNGYTVNLAKFFGLLTDEYPKVSSYHARLTERPAFQTAIRT